MQGFRYAAIICLLPTISFAQNMIDTRGKAYRDISGHLARGTGTRVVPGLKVLSGVFTIIDPANLTSGSHFDYELVVTNDSDAAVGVPQTLDWKEVDNGHASQNFARATLWLTLGCLNNYSTELDHFVLYGSEERPETETMLNPGDSVRILGSGLMPLHPDMRCQSKGAATFLATFQVDAMTLQRKPKPATPDAYSLEEGMLAVANGKKEYPIVDSH